MNWSRMSADPWLTVSARSSPWHLARTWPAARLPVLALACGGCCGACGTILPAMVARREQSLGERGKEAGITWYDVLGVLPGASAEQVQRQHDAKASLLRPELVAGAPSPVVAAASRAREILDAARRVLADPASRARYDEAVGIRRTGGAWHRARASPPGPAGTCRTPPISPAAIWDRKRLVPF